MLIYIEISRRNHMTCDGGIFCAEMAEGMSVFHLNYESSWLGHGRPLTAINGHYILHLYPQKDLASAICI